MEEGVAPAPHPPGGGAPPGARRRVETPLVRLVERARFAAAVLGDELLSRRQAEVRLAVVHFDDRLRVRPAQSKIQRGFLVELVIVLEVERGAVVQMGPRLRVAPPPLAADL